MWTAKIIDKKMRYGKLEITVGFDNDADSDENFTETVYCTSPQESTWLDKYCSEKIDGLTSLSNYSDNLKEEIVIDKPMRVDELKAVIASKMEAVVEDEVVEVPLPPSMITEPVEQPSEEVKI